ncbi:DoxX family protein [Dyadobacter arcticus]|uniref:DoxX-like family protein n=1 Tax=Dyadobacter arcticus TaxID=1078754 RepID=A0ABX0UH55_9BACT|nr:DoxX family protein [Dyadobacter arcticus]NIJ52242.1 hypothetical protein [Dyadobacter arcticus]
MKRLTPLYWIVTGLMGAMLGLFSIPDVMLMPEAVALIKHLGYPVYFLPFIGVLKLLGVVVILLPMTPPLLREWVYDGLVFDVTGALYSSIAVGDAPAAWIPPILALMLIVGSYALYRQRERVGRELLASDRLLIHK